MSLEKRLMEYKKIKNIEPVEANLEKTIKSAIDAFYATEQEGMLSRKEFLWLQFKLTQKRWWALQFIVLCFAGLTIISVYDESYIQRGMGIMATLFIILIVPELWKNRTYRCIEVEEASYYSLHQIYAARLVLFGGVDLLLLTLFCGVATIGLHYEITSIIIQFILPMLVTACICFGTLCSKRALNENAAVILSVLWSGVWSFVTMNEIVYTAISFPVWLVFIVVVVAYLCFAICRTIDSGKYSWEVMYSGIEVK